MKLKTMASVWAGMLSRFEADEFAQEHMEQLLGPSSGGHTFLVFKDGSVGTADLNGRNAYGGTYTQLHGMQRDALAKLEFVPKPPPRFWAIAAWNRQEDERQAEFNDTQRRQIKLCEALDALRKKENLPRPILHTTPNKLREIAAQFAEDRAIVIGYGNGHNGVGLYAWDLNDVEGGTTWLG